jgi:4-amino-4-deoxy-L-arabinose transferase-like glycosyltransferase
VVWGVLVLAVTEGLGSLHLLAPVPVGLAWASILGALIWFASRRGMRPSVSRGIAVLAEAPLAWGAVGTILVLTLITGIFGAPNVWDGLTYHLPRVERWVEQGHLGFWATSVDRQLWAAPWSGYAALQFRLLTGGDRLAFLPSWLAGFGLILLTARLVRQLGGGERQAAFGALLVAAMPVVVLHASSVQTDLPAAFWVLAVASLVLEAWQRSDAATDWRRATLVGLATSLAIATKGTVLLALLPWLLLYGWALIRAAGWRALGRPLLIGTCAVLVLNGAIFARNLNLFGDPLGDATTRAFLRLSPFTFNGGVANLLANLSLHLSIPGVAWHEWWTDQVNWILRVPLQTDPALLFPYFGGFHVPAFSTHESLAGSPVSLFLGLLLVGWIGSGWPRLRGSPVVPWVVAGVAALLLHAVLIRWQLFGARLQLASLIWLAPGAAIMLRRPGTRGMVALVAVLAVVPALTGNYLKPLRGERSVFVVPREEQYFAERQELRPVLQRVSEALAVSGCRVLGLVAGYDTPEYLIKVMVQPRGTALQLSHLDPPSVSRQLSVAGAGKQPCAVLVLGRPFSPVLPEITVPMTVRWVEGQVALLMPSPGGTAPP